VEASAILPSSASSSFAPGDSTEGGCGVFFRAVAGFLTGSNCLHCNDSFVADARNRGRQRYCAKIDCRAVSKRTSQERWLRKPANADYFKGTANVNRVRRWRADHPGYWKRSRRAQPTPLQGSLALDEAQPADLQLSASPEISNALQDPSAPALQDLWSPYPPLLVGFIALQTGSALQEDIYQHLDLMAAKGREILRHGAGLFPNTA
jgi:hypothetical protein